MAKIAVVRTVNQFPADQTHFTIYDHDITGTLKPDHCLCLCGRKLTGSLKIDADKTDLDLPDCTDCRAAWDGMGCHTTFVTLQVPAEMWRQFLDRQEHVGYCNVCASHLHAVHAKGCPVGTLRRVRETVRQPQKMADPRAVRASGCIEHAWASPGVYLAVDTRVRVQANIFRDVIDRGPAVQVCRHCGQLRIDPKEIPE